MPDETMKKLLESCKSYCQKSSWKKLPETFLDKLKISEGLLQQFLKKLPEDFSEKFRKLIKVIIFKGIEESTVEIPDNFWRSWRRTSYFFTLFLSKEFSEKSLPLRIVRHPQNDHAEYPRPYRCGYMGYSEEIA